MRDHLPTFLESPPPPSASLRALPRCQGVFSKSRTGGRVEERGVIPTPPHPHPPPGATHRLRVLKPGHVGVVIHGGVRGGVGGASGAGGEDGGPRPRCHRAAQPCGRRRRRARARRKERAAKPSCSQLRSPLPSPPPSPAGPTPSAPARLRNLPPAPTTIVPAHLTPSREDAGGGGAAAGGPAGAAEPGARESGRWVPGTSGAGAAGKKGGEAAGGADPGEEEAGRGEMRRQGLSQPRNCSAGKQRAGAGEGKGRDAATRRDPSGEPRGCGRRGGWLEARRTRRQENGDLKEDRQQMGRGLR